MRSVYELSERELLALAIGNEEEDGRIYADYALALRDDYPTSAKLFSAMADEETSFAQLKDRCRRTVAFITSVDRAAVDGAADRDVELKFPNGMAFNFTGGAFLTAFALPNFYFHVTTAYAILRAQGVALGKADFLAHMAAAARGAGG